MGRLNGCWLVFEVGFIGYGWSIVDERVNVGGLISGLKGFHVGHKRCK